MRSRICLAVTGTTVLMGLALPNLLQSAEPLDEIPDRVDLKGLEELTGEPVPPRYAAKLSTQKADTVDRDERPHLRVFWRIAYTGKRWPLVILEPSLDRETEGQTKLSIIAVGKSGQAYRWVIRSLTYPKIQGVKEDSKLEWFREVPKEAGAAEGTIEVDLEPIREVFVKRLPKEFSAAVTPKMYIQLVHQPFDRGEHLHLDAWIGYLSAGPREVDLKKW